ncbi:MAG TPA: class I SAM-dependent methyltransferase [Gaiellaceae bacterium]|nr:class I SAM-dependent methyltransferase [Gaiellaceae bacterium]
MTPQQRLIRLMTDLVVRVPVAWRLLRGPMRANFDALAPVWDATRAGGDRLLPMQAALDAFAAAPARVLDLGTGTGVIARLVAERWPEAEVVGVDLSPKMVDEARRLATSDRQRYEVADSTALPFPDGSFDAVLMNNMIPFFDEIARVVAPGGHVVVAFAIGARTPIYVPLDRVRRELERRGLRYVRDFRAGLGESLLAHRPDPS